MSPGVHLTTVADSVIGTLPCCDDPPLALALLHALAGGEAISDSRLATITDRDEAQVTDALARWPNVQRDEQGRVIAFGGLSLHPTAHRFKLGGARAVHLVRVGHAVPARATRPGRVRAITVPRHRGRRPPDRRTRADP